MQVDFIVGITFDTLLGYLAKPFLIQKPKDKGFYPIEAQISEHNISKYETLLNDKQKQIFQITQEYSEKNLFKIFKSVKHKNTKDFLTKLKKEEADKKIRPFIEKRLVKITDILGEADIEVYFKDKHRFINRDNRVFIRENFAETVFNIIKDHHETRYFLSIKQDNKEIKLLDTSYTILVNEPCRIVVDNTLFAFPELDAKKLLPFFKKEYITVPPNFEKKWFETFALQNIKKYAVNPVGFDIEKANPDKKAVLSLEEDLKGFPAFILTFHYGKHSFYALEKQQISVELDTSGASYKFKKITRDAEWEKEILDFLKNSGLSLTGESHFYPETEEKTPSEPSSKLHFLIDWLKEHYQEIEQWGIEIRQKFFSQQFTFEEPAISVKTEEKQDWFDIKAEVVVKGFRIPFIQLKDYILDDNREIKLPDGTYALLPEEWFERYPDLFKFGKIKDKNLLVNKHHFKIIDNQFPEGTDPYIKRLKDLSKSLQEEAPPIAIPSRLGQVLRSYQKTGFHWMHMLHKHHFGGCLADDMGLGKTIQALTLLSKIKEEVPSMQVETKHLNKLRQLNFFDKQDEEKQTKEVTPTFLIVMPTSLIHNWMNEIKKFTPWLSIYKHTGINRTTHPLEFYKYDIVLTTYGIVRNDFEALSKVSFYYIILDESQYIKNPASKIYRAVNELKSHHKLVLTGTPIENSLSDLWAQLNFLNKGLLGNYNFFRNEFLIPIEKYKDQRKEEKLNTIISPFILRRTKHQVAKELPEKMEQVIYCEMTEKQYSLYESEKSRIRNSILEQIENTEDRNTLHILDGLSKLRQTANHPLMIDEDYQGESGKFIEITDYLESLISEGHKVLVFSSYKKHLRLVENYLHQNGNSYTILTGETYDRQEAVNAFQNNGCQVFLIQIKAGGFGLNLTAADYVMILDPWWNPAVEEQAINRAHRIGQDKKVMIYRFISLDTVEEKIQKLQSKKARLAESFIKPKERLGNLSKEEILELFE